MIEKNSKSNALTQMTPDQYGRDLLRKMIWLYFILLIVEGAIRKWIFPGLASIFLIIRDPLVIAIYGVALNFRLFPWSISIILLFFIGFGSLVMTLFVPTLDYFVIIYGVRCNYLHLPLIFIMGNILRYQDIIEIGKFVMKITLPLTALMVVQFFSPPDAWINKGAGAEAIQIRATVGNIRPPSVFSFVTGVAEFFGLVTAFLLYNAINKKRKPISLIVVCALSLIAGCMVSISRLTLSGVIVVIVVAIFSIIFQPSRIRQYFLVIPMIFIMILSVSQFDFASQALLTFQNRIAEASEAEGGGQGFVERVFRSVFSHFMNLGAIPFTGYGLGVGTAVGSHLLTGEIGYLLSEDEIGRNLYEGGPIFGLAYVAWRWGLIIYLFVASLKASTRGYHLPIYLLGASLPLLLMGQISRPTTLGFMVFCTGLCLAAIQTRPLKEDIQLKMKE